jgi:hypothetical protein
MTAGFILYGLKLDERRISNPKLSELQIGPLVQRADQSTMKFSDFGFSKEGSSNLNFPSQSGWIRQLCRYAATTSDA